MSFLKSVETARARLRENATPCDTRDIATDTPETVAMSQESQGGPCPETTEPVAMSQMSQRVTNGRPDPTALERLAEAFYLRAGMAKSAAWGPTDAEADVTAFHDLADEWRHRSPHMAEITARGALMRAMRAAQARGLLPDVDIAALEAVPPRATMCIGQTFDADLREASQ